MFPGIGNDPEWLLLGPEALLGCMDCVERRNAPLGAVSCGPNPIHTMLFEVVRSTRIGHRSFPRAGP